MKLSLKEVEHIALLARLGLSEQEKERVGRQLSVILENMDVLAEVDTTDVPPTAQAFFLQNVLREDNAAPSLDPQDVLANAPARESDCFRVRPVLE
ncbi:MAG: Asp-tRNA(Asn)/Glu-tRNA(Gln) amidotransferase subunit GatC [Chloroflexi bacterium]|nr:Asp-tRNA(Asn)/Glu-tRNA(Gln) amidotransferase subunit GatC [Chloroflexota bacterium]